MDPSERRLCLEDTLEADSPCCPPSTTSRSLYPATTSPSPTTGHSQTLPTRRPPRSRSTPWSHCPHEDCSPRRFTAQSHCKACEPRDVLRMSDWTQMTVEEPPAITEPSPA